MHSLFDWHRLRAMQTCLVGSQTVSANAAPSAAQSPSVWHCVGSVFTSTEHAAWAQTRPIIAASEIDLAITDFERSKVSSCDVRIARSPEIGADRDRRGAEPDARRGR